MTMTEVPSTPTMVGWRGVMCTDNTKVGDGREFGTFDWRALPLPLKVQPEDVPGHDGSIRVGRIDRIWKDEAGVNRAEGVLFVDLPEGAKAALEVERRVLRGVSVDPGGYELELIEDSDGDITARFTSYTIGAATLVTVPAFAGAWIALDGMPDPDVDNDPPLTADEAAALLPTLVASGAPVENAPPRAWFENPNLDRRRGLHIEASGQVWGHLYGWGECHVGSPAGRCIRLNPDKLGLDFAYMVGTDGRGVLCADGSFVRTGPLCITGDHAALNLGWLAAKDHYASTSLAVADIVLGVDDHGIWCAGAVRPDAPPDLVRTARASAPSVDCRAIGGRLEVVAVLSVNMPGYPGLAARIEDGEPVALVASGGVIDDGSSCGCGTGRESLADAALAAVADLARVVRPIVEAEAKRQLVAESATVFS